MNALDDFVAWVLLMLLLLFGSGCADTKIVYQPFEVRVPVPVPCAAPLVTEPGWATERLKKADTLDEKAKALLEEREQRKGFEAKQRAALDGCR